MGGFDVLSLVPLIFVVVGAGIGVLGLSQAAGAARLRRRGVRTSGVVTELRARRGTQGAGRPGQGGSQVTWHPVVLFATADGRDVQTVSPVGSRPPTHRVGDRVTLVYDPDDPSSILLGTGIGTQLGMVAVSVFGAVFAVAGLVWFLHGLGS